MDEDTFFKQAASYSASRIGLYPQPRSSLFRYVNFGHSEKAWSLVEKTLLGNKLPLTSCAALNDPFDASAILINDVGEAAFVAFLKRTAVKFPSIASKDGMISVVDNGRTLSSREIANLSANVFEECFRAERKRIHIASFCRRISSQLLWGHYAGGYSGIAYHFVPSRKERSNLNMIRKIHYERQRPIVFVSEMLDLICDGPMQQSVSNPDAIDVGTLDYVASYLQRVALTKSIEWAYEEEERLVMLGGNDEATFASEELISIIVGPHFNDLVRLNEIVAKRHEPLKIYQARVSNSDYAIEIDWSKDLFKSDQVA